MKNEEILKRKRKAGYIILSALENVVTTKGSTNQNHGLKPGIISITVITAADIKKYNHHLPVPSVVFI